MDAYTHSKRRIYSDIPLHVAAAKYKISKDILIKRINIYIENNFCLF